jgi:hypothetical protein
MLIVVEATLYFYNFAGRRASPHDSILGPLALGLLASSLHVFSPQQASLAAELPDL